VRRLRVPYEIGRAVGALEEPDEVVGRLLEAVLDVLGAERGVVGLSDGKSDAGRRIERGGRERGEDVLLLAELFLHRAARRLDKRIAGFSNPAIDALRGADWPGNVRQLRNAIERSVILAEGPMIGLDDLPALAGEVADAAEPPGAIDSWKALLRERAQLDEAERRVLQATLRRHQGVFARAARELGLARSTLLSRMEALGISAREPDGEPSA
jgi:DNA-binding NtrC family response regulator